MKAQLNICPQTALIPGDIHETRIQNHGRQSGCGPRCLRLQRGSRHLSHDPLFHHGAPDATHVIIAMGSVCETITEVIDYLEKNGIEYKNFGTYSDASVDYPAYGKAVANAVASGECEQGILICGTGIGISIAANKVKGIRCALCGDVFSAKATREHNDANILAMGARVTGAGLALEIVKAFLETPFSNDERHIRRINQIED